MKTPVIIVNFKAYPQAIGEKAVALAKVCASLSKFIGIAVQSADIYRCSRTGVPVFAQHVDLNEGAHTGSQSILAAIENGAVGSLVNHSEHPLPLAVIKKTVAYLQRRKMTSIVCANSVEMVKKITPLTPDFIAYEPPALIGGKVSVSSAQPEVILDAVRLAGNKSKILVGAGVHTTKDVRIALQHGAKGVLVSSGVVLAKNQKNVLMELVRGMDYQARL